MISLDKRVITSVNLNVDLDECDEFQAFEKIMELKIGIMEGVLESFEKAFVDDPIYALTEVNQLQFKAYQLHLRVLRSIYDNFLKNGTYINMQPSKTLLKNIKKTKECYHELIEKCEALGMKDGDYLMIVNHVQEHHSTISAMQDLLQIN